MLTVQLGNRDARMEFDVLFEELMAWKDSYRTTLVPKQVPLIAMTMLHAQTQFIAASKSMFVGIKSMPVVQTLSAGQA